MTRRPMSSDERSARTVGQMIPGTLGGRSRVATPVRSAPNIGAAIGSTAVGGSGSAGQASSGLATHLAAVDPHPAANHLVEGGWFDDLTLSVAFRFGIDSDGSPYFDPTGMVPAAEAARLMLSADGQPLLEPMP